MCRFFPKRDRYHSTSFDIILHHILSFHTHSFTCCIHTSYGPPVAYEHIRRHSMHMSHTHIIIHHSLTVSYGRHLQHVSFITHTTSYNIIQHHTSYTHHTLMHHMLSLCHIHYHILDLHEVVYSYSIIQIIRMSYNVIHEPHTLESEMSLYDYV